MRLQCMIFNFLHGVIIKCGTGDPDCAEKSAVVYGCEDEVDSPVECIKGICTQGLSNFEVHMWNLFVRTSCKT